MIHVYYSQINEKIHDVLIQKYLHCFPKDFQKKLLRYHRWQDAQLSLLGRLLLNLGMEEVSVKTVDSNIHIRYDVNDKPHVENSELKFNISHSGKIAICAMTTLSEIGVDIEEMKPSDVNEFKTQMTDSEWLNISRAKNKLNAFYDYWTRKEAVIKADGEGLSIPLTSFQVINSQCKIGDQNYLVNKIDLHKNYICHYAVKDSVDTNLLKVEPTEIPISQILMTPIKNIF